MTRDLTDEQARLLLLIADNTEKIPKEEWDFGTYATFRERALVSDTMTHGCGTVGCAIGWATTIPEIAATGLRLGNYCYRSAAPVWRRPGDMVNVFYWAQEVLGLDGAAFERLFVPHEDADRETADEEFPHVHRHDATREDVATEIRAFVAECT